jgi:OmpA-OmpF porin, OOP family
MRLFFTLGIVLSFQVLTAQDLLENPFASLNSPYDEQNPFLSPDGNTLYFTIGNHPQNIGGKRDPGDIWFSTREGKTWSAPKHAGQKLNDRAYNAVAGMSAKGEQLILHGHYDPSGATARTQGISVATKEANGWSRPANISIPYYQNKSAILSGTVSPDGSVFVFAAETYGSYGVEDLYVTFQSNGKWSEPKNLGAVVNTPFQELCPSVSADLKTLYFSSNGRMGRGSFDVYSATRLDDSWTNWTQPVNLGSPINTPGRELFFKVYNTNLALFTTTSSSDRYGVIKLFTPEVPFAKNDSIVAIVETPDTLSQTTDIVASAVLENKPEPLPVKPELPPDYVSVYGKVTNSKTGEVIPARMRFTRVAGATQLVQATANGYVVNMPFRDEYRVAVEANGYVSKIETLNVRDFEMKELELNFSLQPVEVGTIVNLKSVLFVQAKTDILPESFEELDLVVDFLKNNPTVKIDLAGHTDNRGVHNDNVKLSQQRVNKVKEYLVSKGIESKRISGKGYGGTKPIASNDTEESRRMNRRVEFTIKRF